MRRRALALLSIAVITGRSTAGAQATADAGLAAIDSLVAAGDLDGARSRLAGWLTAHPPGPGAAGDRAHALFLQARLAPDWTGAEDALLSVVLGYPTAPDAPASLLLLGKGLVAAASTGRPPTAAVRAASYLERLVHDYPGTPLHDEARLWLARAWSAAGRRADACALLREHAARFGDGALAAAARADSTAACAAAGAGPAADATPSARPAGPFAIQVAALRSRDNADQLAIELRNAGFDARIVAIDGSDLLRVRIGSFPTAADAGRMLERIRATGFDGAVVDDVAREARAR